MAKPEFKQREDLVPNRQYTVRSTAGGVYVEFRAIFVRWNDNAPGGPVAIFSTGAIGPEGGPWSVEPYSSRDLP